ILAARDRHKSYTDRIRKPLELEVVDMVMLKLSPWKGVIHFGKRGKLNPRYIGPFKILAKKCFVEEPLAIPLDEIHIDDRFNFIEEPVEIMVREVKRLKQSCIPIVKVHWNSRRGLEFTWEQIVHKTTEKIIQIKKHILAARDRHKSYTDRIRKPLELEVVDMVMLKVSPWKGVIHFGKRGKLNPRYIGPFKILAKKCFVEEPLAIPLDEIHIDDRFNFIEEPVEIMVREVKRLKQSCIPIVKVHWNSRRGLEFTWEREDQMKKK
nr:putative reverse transcriptase domain-containing protein [Tanacetum cinerariifolium]